jgi:hypothetical protein
MFWWFNVYNWPFSGSVAQDIHPALLAQAGDRGVEREVLDDVASYGKQIGVIADLLLSLAKLVPPERLDADAQHAFDQLKTLVERIGDIKARRRRAPVTLAQARTQFHTLLERFPELARELPAP